MNSSQDAGNGYTVPLFPVLTAVAGVIFLTEPLTARLIIASLLILGGIALTLARQANSTLKT